MTATRRLKPHFAGPDRVVVSLNARRGPPPRRDPAAAAATAFASKIDLAAQIVAALGAEAACLRVALPEDFAARIDRCEAALDGIAELHDAINKAEGRVDV